MAASAAASDDQFVIRSGVRTGLKRELEFALRSQAELLSSSASSSLSRLRSRSSPNPPPISANKPVKKKETMVHKQFPATPPGFGAKPEFRKKPKIDSVETAKRNMELKMSKKIALRKVPTDVDELLDTGLLDGLDVAYRASEHEEAVLHGVIKDDGVLCYCSSCNGSKIVSAYDFEQHAGGCKKSPSEYIYVHSGKSLHDILGACASSSLDMLEETIMKAITSAPLEPIGTCAADSETRLEAAVLLHDNQQQNVSLKKKSDGRLTKKDLGLHKLVFKSGILEEGTAVGYFVRGQKLLDGYIKDSGIFCLCCNSVVTPSLFEAHAGQARRKKAYNYIYFSNGVSLHELAVDLSRNRNLLDSETDDFCNICKDGGDVIMCDMCPRVYHKECVGLSSVPNGKWCCENCCRMHQRENFVAYNDNAIAAGRVEGVNPIEQIHKRLIRVVTVRDDDITSCEICSRPDFNENETVFDDLTVIICEQCDKEFHVGCLRNHNMDDLKEVPKGHWFCSTGCSKIYSTLQELALRRRIHVPDADIDIIRRKSEEQGLSMGAKEDVSWSLLSDMTAISDGESLAEQAVSVLRDAFDPIIDGNTKEDLIPLMVSSKVAPDHYCSGMFCIVLTSGSSVVSAAILRIWGCELAELPLVATSKNNQGRGYFQVLFSCIERLLASLNVKHLVLPAAEEAKSIWTKKFGFTKITTDQLNKFSRGARILNFDKTPVLLKPVSV